MERQVTGTQHVSRNCFVCGTGNTEGLKAHFLELEGDELLAVFQPRQEHQGYPGRLHGGIASTILDEAMGRAVGISDPGAFGVTVELSIRFRKPVPVGREVRAVCRITKDSSRLFEGTGEIILEDGTVAVEAWGKYLRMSVDKIVDEDFSDEWYEDERTAPDSVDV